MEDELTPLIGESLPPLTRTKRIQKSLAKHLESNRVHLLVIGLTTLDALFVLSDLSYDFLKDPKCICNPSLCPSEDPDFLEWFEFASIIITGLFLTEIPLALFAFGSKYYTTVEHAWLHLFDALVILSTFILEVFLKGREAEIASLLIILRLWRLIKLVSTVGVGVTEYNEVEIESSQRKEIERKESIWREEKRKLVMELERVRGELEGIRNEVSELER